MMTFCAKSSQWSMIEISVMLTFLTCVYCFAKCIEKYIFQSEIQNDALEFF